MNIRTRVLLSTLCCAALGCAAQPVEDFRFDFSGNLPEGITLIDGDGNTPSSDIPSGYGFAVGTPWVCYYIEKEANYVAASTSWYDPSGTSDDWMVLPSISVTSSDAVLNWRAKATDKRFSDGYVVYVTTKEGNSKADFDLSAPLFSVSAESSAWQNHSVSLAAYAGQTVRIAFVNNSTNCAMLYVDDIFAGSPAAAAIRPTTDYVVKPTDKLVVKGEVFTDQPNTVKGYTLGYQFGDKTETVEYPNAELTPGASVSFALESGVSLPAGTSAELSLWAEHDGQRWQTTQTVWSEQKRVVAEELTGNWCGYCVRGAYYMSQLKELYPETFIGIAVHGQDFLTVSDYCSYIYSKAHASGYPAGIVNRETSFRVDPQNFPEAYTALQNMAIGASASLNVVPNDDGTYTASTAVMLNERARNERYKVAYAFVENDVYEEGDTRYYQHNSYAGGTTEMGGYENLPEYVMNYHFQDVARGFIDKIEGLDGSLPSTMAAGKTYCHETTFSLPETVLSADNVELVAMLIDTTDGAIVNADKKSVTGKPSGIAQSVATAEPDSVSYYTLSGCKVERPHNGIFIVRKVEGGKVTTKKLYLR